MESRLFFDIPNGLTPNPLVLGAPPIGEGFGISIQTKFINFKDVNFPGVVSTVIGDDRGNQLGKAYAFPENVSGSSGLLIILPYFNAEAGRN